MSVNGSDELGHCSPANTHKYSNQLCTEPGSSVLFDGTLPTLTGLDGASQLLTSSVEDQDYVYLSMYFATFTPKVGRVEVIIFNCPEWGISVESIEMLVNYGERYIMFPNTTSCRSLVSLCTDA